VVINPQTSKSYQKYRPEQILRCMGWNYGQTRMSEGDQDGQAICPFLTLLAHPFLQAYLGDGISQIISPGLNFDPLILASQEARITGK
jgi:hypothetical protein